MGQGRVTKRWDYGTSVARKINGYGLWVAMREGENSKSLFVERLADQIISARRNTVCICVHSRTDTEHCDPFLDTSSLVKTRHQPC